MNTFKYKKNNSTLFIDDVRGEMRIFIIDDSYKVSVTLDQVGLDALRNYLDDLETEE